MYIHKRERVEGGTELVREGDRIPVRPNQKTPTYTCTHIHLYVIHATYQTLHLTGLPHRLPLHLFLLISQLDPLINFLLGF